MCYAAALEKKGNRKQRELRPQPENRQNVARSDEKVRDKFKS
jgi:hypothetical protein